jgi:hypothetical protein
MLIMKSPATDAAGQEIIKLVYGICFGLGLKNETC